MVTLTKVPAFSEAQNFAWNIFLPRARVEVWGALIDILDICYCGAQLYIQYFFLEIVLFPRSELVASAMHTKLPENSIKARGRLFPDLP